MLEFVSAFGTYFLQLMNNLEEHHEGSILIVILCVFCEIHFTLGFNWIEDIVFGDMNQNYKIGTPGIILDNLDSYTAHTLSFIFIFYIQHLAYGNIFREPDELSPYSKAPIKWELIDFKSNLSCFLIFGVTTIFCVVICFYQVKFLNKI